MIVIELVVQIVVTVFLMIFDAGHDDDENSIHGLRIFIRWF